MKYLPLFVSLSITILSACQVTQDPTPPNPADSSQIISDRAIPNSKKLVTGQLENGMTYVIKKETQFKGRASLQLLVKAGALQEDEKQRGLAHFVEHMAFNGTQDFPKNDLINYIESAGMKFGQGINAMTYFDKTVYSLIIPSNNKEVFENGFRIIENWAHKVSFDPQEIEKERGVIIEEWRNKDSANYRLESKHLQKSFIGSHYSQSYPLIGEFEDIKFANSKDLVRFYKEWYQPENMVILAVGDFEPYKAMLYINKYMASIPSAKQSKKIEKYYLANNEKPLISIQTDPQATTTSISFRIDKTYQPNLTYKDELEDLKRVLLINMLNLRLQNAIRENKISAIYAKTAFNSTVGQRYSFSLSAISKAAQLKEAIKELLGSIYTATQDGFNEKELALVKSGYINLIKAHRKTINSVKQSNQYINHIMREEPIYDTHSITNFRLDTLPEVTLSDINRLAKDWFKQTHNRHIFISAPESELTTLPTQTELLSLWKEAENKHYLPYQQGQKIEKLMTDLPIKGSIVKHEYNKLYRTNHWTLSNGAKVILRKTKSKHGDIQFLASKKGGLEQLDDETFLKTAHSTAYIDYMGVSDFSVNALNTFLYDKNIKLSSNLYNSTEGLKGSSSLKYLDDFMQFLHLKFTQPRKSEQDFQLLIENKYTQMEKNSQVPLAQFIMAINAEKNKHNPRFLEKYDPKTLKMMDFELSYQQFKLRFKNAADFTFTFIGNIDIEQMEDLITTYIASLPSATKQNTLQKTYSNNETKGHIEVHLKKGVDQKGFVKLEMGGEATWSNENGIIFEAVKNTLNVLLRNKIRETLGGTYNISVRGLLEHHQSPQYALSIEFFCEPERVDELVNAVRSEIERVKREGINQTLLSNFKKQQSNIRKRIHSTNQFWLYKLSNLDPESIFDLDIKLYNKTLHGITIEQVNQAMKAYLTPTNSLYATLLPVGYPGVLTTKQTK